MPRTRIHSEQAPAAIGPYSQAVRMGSTVYFSGQIPLVPATGALNTGDFEAQVRQAFDNLKAVCAAAGTDFNAIARLGLYLTDLANFPVVNQVMAEYFEEPYPARSTIGVASLPLGAQFEVDAVAVTG